MTSHLSATVAQLQEVGLEIRKLYARDDAQRQLNAATLEPLKKVYAARLAILERNDPR